MEKYCKKFEVTPEDYSAEKHQAAWDMRHKEKKTYQDIADKLGVNVKLVSFYVKTNPKESWKLSDWITDYHEKDSSIYEKIDFLVDSDNKLVERFIRAGRKANYLEKV